MKKTMYLELVVEATGRYLPEHRGDSGYSRGVVGLARNPSPPEPEEIEDIHVNLCGLDITEQLTDEQMGRVIEALWDEVDRLESRR